MPLICEATLRLPQFGLSLGEFVLDDSLATLPGRDPCICLKVREYIGPDTLGLAGREYVIPLQALAEFLEKQVREVPANGRLAHRS